MKKTLLLIILIIFLASGVFFNLAIAQTVAETNNEATSVASIVKIKSAGSFIDSGKNLLKEAWQKMTGSKRGEALTKIKTWFTNRKQAIQNGWQEEKKEFHGNIKDIIANAWQKAVDKVKSWVFHKKGD
ncbi:hypothetical protein COX74_02180 [bacterium (Candidatus Gribaldobacteria) CG_4_10_14_0_2_um_filter_41_16]|uniref:Uncharacterized protein n=4 Tax=Candidatus Gribaldobacteria TaxID=2798536 RepID=A0A2M7VI95_9BACT|nr:MAG: hypothetical protein AUJ36_00210 [Parcubacteria group bacterium CG1_02_41_26]PIR90834.1 MAG: hypothetical protein COU03_03940 [bacterium (Candidatus Gribaldobacteria) CG10_big_fil_rev_8_21_14_0_10_41_12]PIV47138.1 MAG: hypothetical protein COS21_01535 [bacterium (Candidatus Gribaldobacteria) CG02_land_8_20_14_3_00_41_15]PIX03123.1 MAG: hypothetical protein COZ78_01995 [bacterium (Candidatus Gribaldobacteria) CG_4_8_14_3_um_filter_42_11]PJA01540.1 MAG: hypothetical protein COX74_02180 [b